MRFIMTQKYTFDLTNAQIEDCMKREQIDRQAAINFLADEFAARHAPEEYEIDEIDMNKNLTDIVDLSRLKWYAK